MNNTILATLTSMTIGITLFAHSSFAETSASTVDAVVVTATRTARSADETLASVSVITRQDIERLQAQSVQDLLRSQAGISITNNGGAGKNTSVFVRGSASDHVLVLIDGIKVGSATSGTTAFQFLNIDQIDRIEIVRGPRSSLYGSEAIGGVIQIFTRKGSKKTTPNFSMSAGKYNTKKVTVGVSGGGDRAWYNLGFSGLNSEGFNSCDGKPSPGGAGCFTTELDDDAYQNQSGSVRAGYRFDNETELDVMLSRTYGSTEFDGGFQNESDFLQQVLGVTVKFSPTDTWFSTLAIGRSLDESDNFKDSAFSTRFNTERDSYSWQNDITIGDEDLITLGVDHVKDNISVITFANFPVTSRDNTGIFAQYQANVNDNDLIISTRHDDNERSGTHTTGSLSWGYPVNKKLRITASYGTAFKAPTFNELFFPGFGNANLQPESSTTFELALRGKTNWGRWDVTAYSTKVDELIAFDANTFAPANIDTASIHGLEAQIQTQVSNWDIDANLTLLDTENESPGFNQGNELPRRYKQSFNINLDRDYGKFSTGISLHANSRTYDDLGNSRIIKAYTTVDLRAAYQFHKDWLLQARIDNVFDRDYETASFYNQAKGDFWLTLRYRPTSLE